MASSWSHGDMVGDGVTKHGPIPQPAKLIGKQVLWLNRDCGGTSWVAESVVECHVDSTSSNCKTA